MIANSYFYIGLPNHNSIANFLPVLHLENTKLTPKEFIEYYSTKFSDNPKKVHVKVSNSVHTEGVYKWTEVNKWQTCEMRKNFRDTGNKKN